MPPISLTRNYPASLIPKLTLQHQLLGRRRSSSCACRWSRWRTSCSRTVTPSARPRLSERLGQYRMVRGNSRCTAAGTRSCSWRFAVLAASMLHISSHLMHISVALDREAGETASGLASRLSPHRCSAGECRSGVQRVSGEV